jgi:putative transcriptional regulator
VRSNIIGMVEGRLLVVTYALRAGRIRIISARKANHAKDADMSKKSVKRSQTDWTRFDAMTDEQIRRAALADPDARPLTKRRLARMRRPLPVKRLRWKLGLSQVEFAERFHIPVGTVRDWEQRRHEPDQAALSYLKIIEANPEWVARTHKTAAA